MSKLPVTVVLSLLLSRVLCAEAPVDFADVQLKAAVEGELWISDPTPTDMLGLTSLEAGSLGIMDLTGIEYATSLQTLWLRLNYITDISPLSGLTELDSLVLHRNFLSDLSPLAGLTKLRHLNLDTTGISDISPLSGLTNLRELDLFYNQIHDLSPLTGLTSLTWLDVRENPLDEQAYAVHIPQIIAGNPGIRIRHDRGPFRLTLSSTAGGQVIHPGEGDFILNDGKPVSIQAEADPGFVFAGFTGSYSTQANPFDLAIGQDYWIRANFLCLSDVLYVDDDARGDPGPGDAKVGDLYENGTALHPFDSVQEAVEVAMKDAIVFVQAGVYRESINFLGKSIRLIAVEADDRTGMAWPVLNGSGDSTVVHFTSGEDPNALLRGFVITRGRGPAAGAIACIASSPTIVNCLIVGNRATNAAGAAIYCKNSNATFLNCTVADNYPEQSGGGMYLVNSPVAVVNSILWGNGPKELVVGDDRMPLLRHSNVAGGWPGVGNIDADPLFASTGYWVDPYRPDMVVSPDRFNAMLVSGDYHLRSQVGRWQPAAKDWTQDSVTSPCIDAGNPSSDVGTEPAPNGGVINMGAYGGTAQASKSGP